MRHECNGKIAAFLFRTGNAPGDNLPFVRYKAVIPAAGLGTRMLPASKSVPKEMLPMVDKPVLQYIVEEAVAAGIEDILIITNRGKGAMDDYFDYAPELERRLEASGKTAELAAVRRPAELANLYFIRQKETKGLGHAIGQARRFVGDEPFAILLGDDIMRAERPVIGQLIEAAEAYDASVIGVQQVPDEMVSKYGVIKAQPLGNKVFTVTDMQEKYRMRKIYRHIRICIMETIRFQCPRIYAWVTTCMKM